MVSQRWVVASCKCGVDDSLSIHLVILFLRKVMRPLTNLPEQYICYHHTYVRGYTSSRHLSPTKDIPDAIACYGKRSEPSLVVALSHRNSTAIESP